MFNRLLAPVLQKVHRCAIEDTERSNTQKERRIIDTLEPVMNQHRLVVSKSLIKKDFDSTADRRPEDVNKFRLFYQLTRITKDKGALAKDDRLDAVALAVHYWNNVLERDVTNAADEHRARLLDEELESWLENSTGQFTLNGTPTKKNGNKWLI
jgi:hypothetical protein